MTALLQPVVEGLGYELWELEYAPGRGNGFLRLYIDAAAGITVDDCERVSRAVSEVLDAADPIPGQYTLEVSSPGSSGRCGRARAFRAVRGRDGFRGDWCSRVDERRRFKGPLVAAGAETIEVEVDGRRIVLPIAGIRKAHLAPDV